MHVMPVDARPGSVHAEIETHLHQILGDRSVTARRYGPSFERFWSIAVERLRGGKLMRPRLLIDVFDALVEGSINGSCSATRPGEKSGPRARVAAFRLASAVEVLHFAFLLHDDVIDQDLVRRGSLNFIGQVHEDARSHHAGRDGDACDEERSRRMHWARSCGILAGDLMLAVAHQVFARVEVSGAMRTRLLDLLDTTVTETVAGEHADIGLAEGVIRPEFDTVLEMTRMKTAAYTFELPLRAAAILAGADEPLEERLALIGRHLGLAYQLQDDLLSAFARSDEHGKDDFSDFREGKQTPLIVFARTTAAWPEIRTLLEEPEPSHETGMRIRRLLLACGTKTFIEAMIRDETLLALEELSRDAGRGCVPPGVAEHVRTLAVALDGRNG